MNGSFIVPLYKGEVRCMKYIHVCVLHTRVYFLLIYIQQHTHDVLKCSFVQCIHTHTYIHIHACIQVSLSTAKSIDELGADDAHIHTYIHRYIHTFMHVQVPFSTAKSIDELGADDALLLDESAGRIKRLNNASIVVRIVDLQRGQTSNPDKVCVYVCVCM